MPRPTHRSSDALRLLVEAHRPGAPVVDDDRRISSACCLADTPTQRRQRAPAAAADRDLPDRPSDRGLDFALDAIVSAGVGWVPVIEDQRVVGIVAMKEIIAGYQRALRRSLHLLADVAGRLGHWSKHP